MLWANASDTHTQARKSFSEGQNHKQPVRPHPQAGTSSTIPTLDRLLFAATPLTVSEHDATANRTVNFSPATMRVSVLLEGISVKPVVRIAGMASALQPVFDETSRTWKIVPVEQGKTVPEVAYDAAGRHAEAVADMPRFRADTPGTVEIIDPATGNLIVPPTSIWSSSPATAYRWRGTSR